MLLAAALFLSGLCANADVETSVQETREKIVEADQAERQLLGTLFTINERMKDMSRKRDRLTDRRLATEGDARLMARNIVQLEGRLKNQHRGLSRRIRALYLMNGQAAMRSLFSSQSAVEFDRNLRFLKLVTDRDYNLIKDYDRSLRELRRKRLELDHQVRRLAMIQSALKAQEAQLATEQAGKSGLLNQLKESRDRRMTELQHIRKTQALSEQDLDTAFFERKGKLPLPVYGELVKSYGYIQDDALRFRLGHKGQFYRTMGEQTVQTVSPGRAAFTGDLPGYGLTAIVDHGDHYYSVYSYLTKIKVSVGESVKEGQSLGSSGGSSPWFGKGLYFEIRHFSDAIDPQPWLNKVSGGNQDEKSKAPI